MIPSYSYWREYYRAEATLYATEEGMFKELPDDLTSGFLMVAVVYRICMVDNAGRLDIKDFNNPPALDKNRVLGGPVTLDGAAWYTEPGPSTVTLACTIRYSAQTATIPTLVGVADHLHQSAVETEGITGTA